MILDSASLLFIEKGYEQTSISDIVAGLDGLTKGAVYHHFESKYQIILEIAQRFVPSSQLLKNIDTNQHLTGLEKIQTLILETMFNEEIINSTTISLKLLADPIFASIYQKKLNEHLIPKIEHYMKEGNKDGSINSPQSKEMAEVIMLLVTTWFIESLFETTADNFFLKLETAQYVLKNSGIDILNDAFLTTIKNSLNMKS